MALRQSIQSALRAMGCHVESDVGLGNLRLDTAVSTTNNGEGSVGVDSGAFLRASDPLARDVYGPRFWSRAGWKIVRVTPTMWRDAHEETLARIVALVEKEESS